VLATTVPTAPEANRSTASAELTVVQQAAQLDQPLVEPVLGHDSHDDPGSTYGTDEPVRGFEADVNRLLDNQVLARCRRPDAHLSVQAAGHAHRYDVDIVARKQAVQVGMGRAIVPPGERLSAAGSGVGDGDEPSVGQRRDGVGVHCRDHAGADDAEAARPPTVVAPDTHPRCHAPAFSWVPSYPPP
jgi:hypothetical protein